MNAEQLAAIRARVERYEALMCECNNLPIYNADLCTAAGELAASAYDDDIRALLDYVAELERDNAAQLDALRGVTTDIDPENFAIIDGVYTGRCQYCHEITYYRTYIETDLGRSATSHTAAHAPDCAWLRAQQLGADNPPSHT